LLTEMAKTTVLKDLEGIMKPFAATRKAKFTKI
jgi:hypothetical protein